MLSPPAPNVPAERKNSENVSSINPIKNSPKAFMGLWLKKDIMPYNKQITPKNTNIPPIKVKIMEKFLPTS